MKVTVEFMAVEPPKIINKEFKTREAALSFMDALSGENIVAYTDDGMDAVYVGWKETDERR